MPRVVIDRLRIVDGKVRYAELNRKQAFRTALAPLTLELGRFSTLPEDRGDYLVAADLAGLGGSLRWKGNVGVNPLASAGTVELQGLKLASLLPLARQAYGLLTLAAELASLSVQADGQPQPVARVAPPSKPADPADGGSAWRIARPAPGHRADSPAAGAAGWAARCARQAVGGTAAG